MNRNSVKKALLVIVLVAALTSSHISGVIAGDFVMEDLCGTSQKAPPTNSISDNEAIKERAGAIYSNMNEARSAGLGMVDPVISLGAKINIHIYGLRFGAMYNRVAGKEVNKIGILLYPTHLLGENPLTLEYASENPDVINISVRKIAPESFVPGKAFKDYDTFVYYATIYNIPEAQRGTNITAVPYIKYTDGAVFYAAPLTRNYTYVYNIIYGFH